MDTSMEVSMNFSPDSDEERKAFRCPQCKYITDRKNNLNRHIVTMHQESTKALQCCGMLFKSKASLRDHVCLFHRGGYCCQICGRNFCRKALLHRHHTVHSGQKDFSCHLCGYATSHKSNLERHQKVHYRCHESLERSPNSHGSNDQCILSTRDAPLRSVYRQISRCYLPNRLSETHNFTVAEDEVTNKSLEFSTDSQLSMEAVYPYNIDEESVLQTVEKHKRFRSRVRMVRNPYKCNGCRNYFTHQRTLFVHKCSSRLHCQPSLPIVNAVRKGKIQTEVIAKDKQTTTNECICSKHSEGEQLCSNVSLGSQENYTNIESKTKEHAIETESCLKTSKSNQSNINAPTKRYICRNVPCGDCYPGSFMEAKQQSCNLISGHDYPNNHKISNLTSPNLDHVQSYNTMIKRGTIVNPVEGIEPLSMEVTISHENILRENDVMRRDNYLQVPSSTFLDSTLRKPQEKKADIWRVW